MCHIQIPSRNIVKRGSRKVLYPSTQLEGMKIWRKSLSHRQFPYKKTVPKKTTNKPWQLNMVCWEIFHSFIHIDIHEIYT